VYQNLLFHVYMKLNMFRATHRPSWVQNCTISLCFCIRKCCWTLTLLDADTNTNRTAVCLLCVLTLKNVKIAYVYVNYISY